MPSELFLGARLSWAAFLLASTIATVEKPAAHLLAFGSALIRVFTFAFCAFLHLFLFVIAFDNRDLKERNLKAFPICLFFQDDKDLVHEFVQNDGLACLIKVGSEADQNYQNYILRGKKVAMRRLPFGFARLDDEERRVSEHV